MRIRSLPVHLSLFLATAVVAMAQQPPLPAVTAHPLYGSRAAANGSAAPTTPSTDPRVLDFTNRLKSTFEQVRTENPAVLPDSVVKAARAGQQPAATNLRQRAGSDVKIRMRHEMGTPRYIEGARLERAAVAATGSGGVDDVTTARNFFRANRGLLQLQDPDVELALQKGERDDAGRRHLRYEQRHNGLRVYPAELSVHLDSGGNVYLMTGAYVPTPEVALRQPKISPDDAVYRARVRINSTVLETAAAPELIIYAPGATTPRLAWKISLVSDSAEWLVVVDAGDGRILTAFNQLASANVGGSGIGVFGQRLSLNVWEEGGSFFLTDTSKPMFDARSNPPNAATTRGGIVVVDARNQPPNNNPQELPPLFNVISATPDGFNVPDAVSAAHNVGIVYDYFLNRHGRNSHDGQGGNIFVVSRLGLNYFNATFSFTGGVMRIGDADAFAASLDVMAHEVAHGVTGTSANLEYVNQSGALNEAFSDVFGEMTEFFRFGTNDWLVGTSMRNRLRSMRDPNGINNQPARMSQFRNLPPDNDNGGVHINSGIINHAYYLLAEGLQGGIGRGDAERIFYRMLTVYLMKNSNFIDARLAAVRSARDLFGDGSLQAQRTAAAFDAVEIFDTQPMPPPRDPPKVEAADSTLFIYGNGLSGYSLVRRETAQNDPVEGRFLGANSAQPRRPSVNGAGTIAAYVTADNDCALALTNGQSESKVGFPGLVHSVAMSPDATRFGFVLRDAKGQPDNHITVFDIVTPNAQPVTYELLAPTADGAPVATIVHADAMAFTADGRFLIYDALNAIEAPNGTVNNFSIYSIELATSRISAVVSPIGGFNIGNPSISKTSDNFITFEAINQQTGVSAVLTSNLNTGNVVLVGLSDAVAYPTYTGGDDAIIFADLSENVTGHSLWHKALTADRQTPVEAPRTLWLADGGYPYIYRRGVYQGPQKPSPVTRLGNISTRLRVLTGERVLIGGFIITGNSPKKVIIRGLGPSLNNVGTTVADPTLRLLQGDSVIATNDDWKEQQALVEETGVPPANDLEAAIVATLNPGSYTAILEERLGGEGVGIVEVYDLAQAVGSTVANISTRGFVDRGDNVMIGGLIITQGIDGGAARVIVRAIGPSLQEAGVADALGDPTLELFSANGERIALNDDWKLAQQAEIEATSLQPRNDLESAVVTTLLPGNYTAIVRGFEESTGVALVEVYHLP